MKRELAAKGIDMSFDVTGILQGLQNGDSTSAFGGKADLRVRLDNQG